MDKKNKNNLKNSEEPNFGLPENYFQKSSESILNKVEWEEEHLHFENLKHVKNENKNSKLGFSIPSNYFDTIPNKIELLLYPHLSALKESEHFHTPVSYFEQNKHVILAKVLQGSDKVDSGVSAKLGSKHGRIIPLFWKRFTVGVAALLILSFGVWMFHQINKPQELSDCKTLACLENEVLFNNLSNLNFENEDLYDLVDPVDLEQELHINSKPYFHQSEIDTESNINLILEDL